jgi:hypothetical protein
MKVLVHRRVRQSGSSRPLVATEVIHYPVDEPATSHNRLDCVVPRAAAVRTLDPPCPTSAQGHNWDTAISSAVSDSVETMRRVVTERRSALPLMPRICSPLIASASSWIESERHPPSPDARMSGKPSAGTDPLDAVQALAGALFTS